MIFLKVCFEFEQCLLSYLIMTWAVSEQMMFGFFDKSVMLMFAIETPRVSVSVVVCLSLFEQEVSKRTNERIWVGRFYFQLLSGFGGLVLCFLDGKCWVGFAL